MNEMDSRKPAFALEPRNDYVAILGDLKVAVRIEAEEDNRLPMDPRPKWEPVRLTRAEMRDALVEVMKQVERPVSLEVGRAERERFGEPITQEELPENVEACLWDEGVCVTRGQADVLSRLFEAAETQAEQEQEYEVRPRRWRREDVQAYLQVIRGWRFVLRDGRVVFFHQESAVEQMRVVLKVSRAKAVVETGEEVAA